jgi:hypothetical protein
MHNCGTSENIRREYFFLAGRSSAGDPFSLKRFFLLLLGELIHFNSRRQWLRSGDRAMTWQLLHQPGRSGHIATLPHNRITATSAPSRLCDGAVRVDDEFFAASLSFFRAKLPLSGIKSKRGTA